MPKLRKKRTRAQLEPIDAALRKAVYAETPVDEIARQMKLKRTYVYTLLRRRLGFETMLIDEHERAAIRQRRMDAAQIGLSSRQAAKEPLMMRRISVSALSDHSPE